MKDLFDMELNTGNDERYLILVENIKKIIDEVEKLKVVTVRNGGGRLISMDRNDFYQLLYDMPKERFTKAAEFAGKTNKILDLVAKIALIVTSIGLLFYFTIGKGGV